MLAMKKTSNAEEITLVSKQLFLKFIPDLFFFNLEKVT